MGGLFGGGGGGGGETANIYNPDGTFWGPSRRGGPLDTLYRIDPETQTTVFVRSGTPGDMPAAPAPTMLSGSAQQPLAAPAPAAAPAPVPVAAPAGPMPTTLIGSLGEHPVTAPAATAASTAAAPAAAPLSEGPGSEAAPTGAAGPRRKRTAKRGRAATLLGDAVSEPETLGA